MLFHREEPLSRSRFTREFPEPWVLVDGALVRLGCVVGVPAGAGFEVGVLAGEGFEVGVGVLTGATGATGAAG
ncbi:MAG: hypothetical protein ABI746_04705 [Dermatophilaceae bacterium]